MPFKNAAPSLRSTPLNLPWAPRARVCVIVAHLALEPLPAAAIGARATVSASPSRPRRSAAFIRIGLG